MKGIILAGGRATRLYPVTKAVCKQLLPVYDKPMIYYPLSVLMLAGIKDILIISTPHSTPLFKSLLDNGSKLGINISYAQQDEPKGIADSLRIAAPFIENDPVCLILGDNLFFGHGLVDILKRAAQKQEGATIFGYYVNEPERYGVVEIDSEGKPVSLEEKPQKPKSKCAVTGLYFFDNDCVRVAGSIQPSQRGELEITDVINHYLAGGSLDVALLGRGFAWLDTGTYDSLLDAASFIKTIEERQGLKIGCIEEIAFRMGYIGKNDLAAHAGKLNTSYADYLMRIVNNE